MRLTDPFPIPHQGLMPTHVLDWHGMARRVVHDVLRIEPHERVILSADPYCGGAMLEAVRIELQHTRAIELATILHWTPALTQLRAPDGNKPDPDDRAREEAAIQALFAAADVFIWLQNDWRSRRRTHAVGQTELMLQTWPGRSVHFHWFHDPINPDPDLPANRALDLVYQQAVMKLDYPALRRRMEALSAAMTDAELRVTNPQGTDICFRAGGRFHLNYGDASRARIAGATFARDREEEIPCGCLRTIPLPGTAEGVIAFRHGFGFPSAGYGLDVNRFFDAGLRLHFQAGRVVRLETDGDQAELDRLWAAETGDRDQLGEFVLGCNPLLTFVPGSSFAPYYGFGEGVLRLTLGENIESGGQYRSSTHRWLMFTDATIRAGGRTLVADGRPAAGW